MTCPSGERTARACPFHARRRALVPVGARAPGGRWVAGSLEVVSSGDQGKRKRNADGRLFVVEALEDVQESGNEHERDRELQGAPATPAKASREQDQREAGGNDQGARQARDGIR